MSSCSGRPYSIWFPSRGTSLHSLTTSQLSWQTGWCKTKPHVDSLLLIKSATHPHRRTFPPQLTIFYSLENTCHNILVSPCSWVDGKRWLTDNFTWKSQKETRRILKSKEPVGKVNVFCKSQECFAVGEPIKCSEGWRVYHLTAEVDTMLPNLYFLHMSGRFVILHVQLYCRVPSLGGRKNEWQ